MATVEQSLKIGIYADYYKPSTGGGTDGYFVSFTKALAGYAPQHEYILLAKPINFELIQECFRNYDISTYCLTPPSTSTFAWRLSKIKRLVLRQPPRIFSNYEMEQINQLDFDIVIFPRQIVHVQGLKARIVVHLFDIQHEYYPQFFPEHALEDRLRIYREAVELADLVIASTDYTKQTVAEKMPSHAAKVKRIYPGLHVTGKTVSDEAIAEVQKKYNLPEQFMFYPANPWIHKNHSRLLAALRIIKEKHGRQLPIVFTGRLISESPAGLEQLVLAAGVESQVYDLGFVPDDDLNALFASAHVLVFPSLFEGFGFPVLEAMANGCPVACADETCLPEVIGDAAFLFDPFDPEVISAAILRLWDDEELRESLRRKGIERITHFTWESSIQEEMILLKDYLGL